MRPARTACLVGLIVAAAVSPAGAATLTGTLVGGPLPSRTAGVASVRAIDARTSVVVSAADVRPGGGWTLTVPNGAFTVATSVVRRTGAPVRAIAPIVRVAGAKRVRVTTSLKRTRARRATPAHAHALRAHATPAGPVVAVRNFAGSGPRAGLGRGLSAMLVTDLVMGDDTCSPTFVEWEGRRELQAEIGLSNSALGDPSTRIRKHWTAPSVYLEGSVSSTADGAVSWALVLRDSDGAVVGGDAAAIPPGGDVFAGEQDLAKRLLDELCGARYDVTLALRTDQRTATYDGSGTIGATIEATGTRSAKGNPPTRFSGGGTLVYGGVTFTSKDGCIYTQTQSIAAPWDVTLQVTSGGRLAVTLNPGGAGLVAQATATVLCPSAPPVAGLPGPILLNATPLTFELPLEGGRQAIAGGVLSGGEGFTHAGTLTVTRRR